MTAKDVTALADALAASHPESTGYGFAADTPLNVRTAANEAWYKTYEAISAALEADNPRFDRGRFSYHIATHIK